MNRAEKQVFIKNAKELFDSYSSVLVVHYQGLTVSELSKLRREASKGDVEVLVVKNKLASIASRETMHKDLAEAFTGPVAVVCANDPVQLSKLVVSFAKSHNKMKVVSGSVNGRVVSLSDIQTLSTLPSMDELRAKIVMLVNSPATKLVQMLNAAPSKLARVVAAKGSE